jgi:hypothetical protein
MARPELVIASDDLGEALAIENATRGLGLDVTVIHAGDAIREATRVVSHPPLVAIVTLTAFVSATDIESFVRTVRPAMAVFIVPALPIAPALRRAAHRVPSAILQRGTAPTLIAATIVAMRADAQAVSQ